MGGRGLEVEVAGEAGRGKVGGWRERQLRKGVSFFFKM